jgi:hypothetical protein
MDAVTCGRVFVGEIGSEGFASLVEVLPIGDVGQRGNGDELALIESCELSLSPVLSPVNLDRLEHRLTSSFSED